VSDIREIPVEQASRERHRYRVIDVRPAFEYDGPLGHVPGSERMETEALLRHAQLLAEGRPLLLVCRSGNRSGRACASLAEVGLEGATNLTGGMIAWNRAGLEVERARPETPEQVVETAVAWLAMVTGTSREEAAAVAGDAGTAREALDRIEAHARDRAPADLEITLAALRRDLASLATP